ncbi:MAG TPA: methyltransferase domain-containing protein [Solirubrobacterales bacterium]|nr:methyltransferase domain-containing protein [Solirubrobacterales bacterium]
MANETAAAEAGAQVEYGSFYYQHYWGGGGPYERNERWLEFFGKVADGIVRDLHPTSVLDAGCAMGFLVEALANRGVDAWGIDVSEYAISQVDESVRDRCQARSLTEPLERRYDLITCIEVIEHIPPEEADQAIANLCAATDRLLLSTTPQDFGEPTHVNVQPPEYWSAALARHGFFRDVDRDFSYLSPWAGLYTRREEDTAETVRRYDRAWWRLRREVAEVRESLMAVQEQAAELESGQAENRPETLRQLDSLREETLRLRDLLIARDAELGTARGRLSELEDQTQRVANVANRVQSRIPRVMRLFGSLLRRLRTLARG